ncbi:hypothetical protein [Jannaschia faecimaris]|nr:hypothetical protein [Jannaschia faecimaris]
MNLPFWGAFCIGDMTVDIAGYSLNLLHPGVAVSLILALVLCTFIFKSPT